ncbi:hypothetical protein WDU94_007789 [Cyamophila willieti]
MMLLVQCGAFIVLFIIVICHADDAEETTEIHGDITGPGPGEYLPTLPEEENMFAKVFKYAFDNYYKNSSATKKISSQKTGSQETRRKSYRHYPRQNHYYNPPYQANPPVAPYQAMNPPVAAMAPYQAALPPQYIFPQHYYMPPAPPVPPYPMYHYPPPPYPPHAYPYPYPPPQHKEKSAETKTTQNLWELYKQLKAKFETTVITNPEPTQQEFYHRHYNRRVQNGAGGFVPRDSNRRFNYQYHHQQQQQEAEKVPEEPFVRYTPMQSSQRRENERSPPINYRDFKEFKVKETELRTSPPIITTVTHPQENPQGITVGNVRGNENIFEPREEDDEKVKSAKVRHWEGIINNIKSSLGITDPTDSNDITLPEYVKRDHADIASLFFTESPEDLEAKKYGITLIQNSQADSYERNDGGFDWKAAEVKDAAAKATKDWVQLYKEYKEKYEFPDYLQEKRRIERAEFKAKKKMLYKFPCSQEFKDRHDKMGKIVHRALAEEFKVLEVDPTLSDDEYEPEAVLENEKYKLLWDLEIAIPDRQLYYNRPDMVIWNKKKNTVRIVDFAVVNYDKVLETRLKKMAKYSNLAKEIMRQWGVVDVKIIPIIVTTSGGVPSCLRPNLSLLGVYNDDLLKRLHDSVILSSYFMYKHVEHNNFHSHESPRPDIR